MEREGGEREGGEREREREGRCIDIEGERGKERQRWREVEITWVRVLETCLLPVLFR